MKCSFAEGECFWSHPKCRYSHCLWKPQTVWSPEFPGWKEVWGLMCSVQMAEQSHSSPGWGSIPGILFWRMPHCFCLCFFNNCMSSFGWTVGEESKKCKELSEDPGPFSNPFIPKNPCPAENLFIGNVCLEELFPLSSCSALKCCTQSPPWGVGSPIVGLVTFKWQMRCPVLTKKDGLWSFQA